MKILAINAYNSQQSFKGQVKLRSKNLDIFDINLLKEKGGDIAEFAKNQKYDYIISKEFKMLNVTLMEKGRQIDNMIVVGYKDKEGNRNIERVFDTIKLITKTNK